jgi:hypothetical protein
MAASSPSYRNVAMPPTCSLKLNGVAMANGTVTVW